MMKDGQEKKINITENFRKFTDNLSNKNKINESLGLSDLEVLSIETYYDNEVIDINKIQIEKIKKDGDKYKFNITSKNTQPIECFYNEEFNMKYNKKYIDLDVDSVILNEGEIKYIEVEIKDKPNKETILSLYMNRQEFSLLIAFIMMKIKQRKMLKMKMMKTMMTMMI